MSDDERKTVKALKSRRPEEWARQIKNLEIPFLPMPGDGITQEHIRTQVANIVFWDFFGGRTCSQRWPQLDRYLNRTFVKIPKEVIREGLVLLGYPVDYAKARIK